MKYMGSKRWMLRNGLGDLLAAKLTCATRFVDLFAGSSAVSSHVASKYKVPVRAFDLQSFSVVLAKAVIARTSKIDAEQVWVLWYERAKALRNDTRTPPAGNLSFKKIKRQRVWCSKKTSPITKAYGGHYFSALQAVWIDALRKTLPRKEPERSLALAALIRAASKCAAAPGHTAQPFQPTQSSKPFVKDAWCKRIPDYCRREMLDLSNQFAKVRGSAHVGNAVAVAKTVRATDLVFIDPPYSGVHYSRFYHVLETIARGSCGAVSGIGRYPQIRERPQSDFSRQTTSENALDNLLRTVMTRRAKAILTFPSGACSNGLSGSSVRKLARNYFRVFPKKVMNRFSTLGGNNKIRNSRKPRIELILYLTPKKPRGPMKARARDH